MSKLTQNININDVTYDKYLDGECGVVDSHCHIGLVQQPSLYASALSNFQVLSFGTRPELFKTESKLKSDNIDIGLGLHPWEVENTIDEVNSQLAIFFDYIEATNFIGEIGLDYSHNRKDNKTNQVYAFTEICKTLSKLKNKVVSIHSVKAADDVLEILRETGADINNNIVFHWFTGSQEQLTNAIRRGYYFSCGPKMFNTRKGYNYVQQIPSSQLLIETDLPWDNEPLTPSEHLNILNDFLIDLRDVVE